MLPAQNHVCAITSWPTAYGNISCTLAYQTLTIAGAFGSGLVIGQYAQVTMKWIVHLVDNPEYALTTSPFRG